MSLFPQEIETGVAIYHVSSGQGNQSYPSIPDLNVQGGFMPLDRHAAALEGGQYSDPHDLFLDPTIDIRKADKLVINGSAWYVKHVFTANFGSLAHIRATVSREL